MDVLETIIKAMTSDEVRRFKILSNRFKSGEKKLIILFDALRFEKFPNEDELIKDIYLDLQPKTRNRYYRLRNKLLENLGKSLVFYHFRGKKSIFAFYDLQIATIMKERGRFALALYFLKKAEKKATELEQFQILEFIYEEYVQLAMQNIEIDMGRVIAERRENQEKLRSHQKNTEAIAAIRQQLKKAKISKAPGAVPELLAEITVNIEADLNIFQSEAGKLLLIRNVSTILYERSMFIQLAEYLLGELETFERTGSFNQQNHSDRILMRLRLIFSLNNCYCWEEVRQQLVLLEKEMEMYDRQNYRAYVFNYYQLKLNNLKLLGHSDQYFSCANEALIVPEIGTNPERSTMIRVNLAAQYFSCQRYDEALSVLGKVNGERKFAEMEESLRFQVRILEMVCKFELGKFEEVVDDFKPFKREFRVLLKDPSQERLAVFAKVLLRLNQAPLLNRKVSINSTVRKFANQYSPQPRQEASLLDPLIYLRSLKEESSYYDLFLREVQRVSNNLLALTQV